MVRVGSKVVSMREERAKRVGQAVVLTALLLASLACGRNAAPPPPQPGAGTSTMVAPPGQVLVTVAASSTPAGAVVTGGGRMLGRTPFTTQVPIPAPTPGQTQTFQFTFQLPGFQPSTISASPVNNTITLNAALMPTAGATGAIDPTGATAPGGGGARLTARGTGGGRIFDYHTTTATARVDAQCMIDSLEVDVDGNHTCYSDLEVSLRGPDGTGYSLQSHSSRNPFRSHSVRRAAGHPSAGPWILAVEDSVGADSGNLRGFSLTIRCR